MTAQPDLTIIVPTFNESPNVAPLVRRLERATTGFRCEVLFVDDSSDDTPAEVVRVAAGSTMAVRVLHRDEATGGLSGAVIEGLRAAGSDVCVVMDGDLQHPPEVVRDLVDRFSAGDADVVVASRYVDDGSSEGLAGLSRNLVSRTTTALTKAMFPLRLRSCTDPMTGFFLVDRRRIDLETLRPRGFKILLEVLARQQLRIAEVPFQFAERIAGGSKASVRQGFHFIAQLAALRFGKMSGFAAIGLFGALLNLLILWTLTEAGLFYLWAAVIASEVTIVGNFLLQERFVFREMLDEATGRWSRFAKSFAFNNAEAVIRIPMMGLMVESWHISSVLATAITLVIAFIARYAFHALVVYAPRKPRFARRERVLQKVDEQATAPGEL
ncbi:glycosyltransferase family 2 protein [Microbacterium betulae]|uniref:Glycosyltransferase family 2 protein n=1 Tax=Microbacterium betulae TaxID=2981139 RepID=A0AA97FJZ3_9MICO|nr:glycosyltransferase family 2 protein [Microbacterium sp. AB]WOF24184.1 glycosyltransferase family 2 protein [Microbacterium sp. AB]